MSEELFKWRENQPVNKSKHVVGELQCSFSYYSFVERYISHKTPMHFHIIGRNNGLCALCTVDLERRDINPAMLVDVAEFMQNPEIRSDRIIPSSVRLQSLDLCTRTCGDANHGALGDFVTETLSVSTDRERRVISGVTTRRGAQFPCKIIDGTPEILKAVPDDVWNLPRKLGRDQIYCVRVRIGPDFILSIFEVSVDSDLERIAMFLGPTVF